MNAIIHGSGIFTLPPWLLTAVVVREPRIAVAALGRLYGVLRFLHLLGTAGLVGMVGMLDLRGLGLFPPGSLDPIRARLGLMLQVCFWLTITTGVALFLRNPLGIGLLSMFLPKLLLIVLGYAHARVLQRLPALRCRPFAKRLAAGVSLRNL
jgi:hypothetical protein